MFKRFGIDTSFWQGDFNFERAKEQEKVEFAILKIGGGDNILYKDSQFDNSYRKCKECELPIGAYFFGHAFTIEDAKKESAYLIRLLKDYQFEYPIFYDVEGDMFKVDKRTLTDIIIHVCSALEDAGYWAGVYSSSSNIQYYAFDDELKRFSHWVANWSATTPPVLKSGSSTQMWQFGGSRNALRSTKINGQTVDQSYCYVDYPTMIKKLGLNNMSKQENGAKQEDVQYKEYTVVKGDTLWNIATKLLGAGLRYTEIVKLNNLTSTTIYPNQVLKIPNK